MSHTAKDCPADSDTPLLSEEAQQDVEQLIETDPALVPQGPSALLVESAVLDPHELNALLSGLEASLAEAAIADWTGDFTQGASDEPHTSAARRDRRHSKLSPLAWLFPNDAGIGRSARHQQSHHLRARRRAGKKTRPPSRQAQGSLFGNNL